MLGLPVSIRKVLLIRCAGGIELFHLAYQKSMQQNNNIKIIAIDPGTKEMGVAMFQGQELIYHGVKTIKKRKYPHEILKEARKFLLRLIKDFNPQALVIEKTFFASNRNIAMLNVLADEIKAVAKRKGIQVISFAPSTVKKYICKDGRAEKREVAKVVISKYPELKVYLTQDRKWKEDYWLNVFDAVALGMMALVKRKN